MTTKHYGIIALAVLWFGAMSAAMETVQDIVDAVNQASYTDYLANQLFTHYGDDREWGDEHDLARDAIFEFFDSFGLNTSLEPFSYSGSTHHNVVGIHEGTRTPENVYLIGAHYDSTNSRDSGSGTGEIFGAPGADDNASGVAGILEAARVLSQSSFESTLVFVAFDREEQGMIGSAAYVDAHPADNVCGMISVDMIAYHPFTPDSPHHNEALIYYADTNSALTANLAEALATYGEISSHIDHMGRSDHVPFDDAGFDAALLIEYAVFSNPNYHKWSDSVDSSDYLDYTYATNMTRGLVGYLATSAVLVAYFESDFNQDGDVDHNDLLAWQTGFGIVSGATGTDGDTHGNGCVDGADFLVWQQQFGSESAPGSSSAAVPEPAAIRLILFGSIPWIWIGMMVGRRVR